MNKPAYNKPPLSYQEQLDKLKERGLQIPDEAKAIHLLGKISYYRLSGYWYPLLADKRNHIFKEGASFETAFQLYCFDRKLRQAVAAELEKIEVAIRAKMVYVLSHAYGPFWYLDPSRFQSLNWHTRFVSKIVEDCQRSDEEFISAFKSHYSNSLPPSWMIFEITSFGTLSTLFKNLKLGRERREIASAFGLSDTVFETWLHSIVYLRNVCAHHTRLWNRPMRISPQLPRRPRMVWLTNSGLPSDATIRSYLVLSMILYLLQSASPNATFASRIKNLLASYPNVDPVAMGFPENWQEEPLWQSPA